MTRIRRFMLASGAEQGLFLSSVIVMGVARIALLVFPLRRVVATLNALNRRWHRATGSSMGVRRAALRIAQAASWCPIPTTCLSRTIAAYFLMSRLGFSSTPRIGVTTAGGSFGAHAWLECEDEIVIGDKSPDGNLYHPVPSLERFFS